jgi:hypothetical protein
MFVDEVVRFADEISVVGYEHVLETNKLKDMENGEWNKIPVKNEPKEAPLKEEKKNDVEPADPKDGEETPLF